MTRPPKQYIPITLLRDVTVLSLTADQVHSLTGRWEAKKPLVQAWADIEVLADRFLVCEAESFDATDRWHHLLMAVGNFKRRGGLILPAVLPRAAAGDQADRPERIVIPGAHGQGSEVKCGDPKTWLRLTKSVRGLSVPTATALLSALWPDYHVIVDQNDRDAAVGLDAAELLVRKGLDDGWFEKEEGSRWTLYEWFRDVVVKTASSLSEQGPHIIPQDVERALFVLGRETATFRKAPVWTWSEYHDVLVEKLVDLQP